MAEVVALGDVASIAGEHGGGGGGFDAFGDRRQAQGVGEVDDGAHDRCGTGIFGDGGDERAVEFDFVDRQFVEVVQRGVAAAEIVDGDA